MPLWFLKKELSRFFLLCICRPLRFARSCASRYNRNYLCPLRHDSPSAQGFCSAARKHISSNRTFQTSSSSSDFSGRPNGSMKKGLSPSLPVIETRIMCLMSSARLRQRNAILMGVAKKINIGKRKFADAVGQFLKQGMQRRPHRPCYLARIGIVFKHRLIPPA